MRPYREPSELPQALSPVPREFVYFAAASERRNVALRRMAGLLWLGGVLCVATAWLLPSIGAWLSALYFGLVFWKWRDSRKPERIAISVDNGQLEVSSRTQSVQFRLEQLHDVALQSRSIEKAYVDKMVGTAVVSMAVMPSIDVSRIAMVYQSDDEDDEEERTVILGTDYEPSSQVTEWLGKLRVFLRKHGWVPLDERDPQD